MNLGALGGHNLARRLNCGRQMNKLWFLPEGPYIIMKETTAHNFSKWKIN